MPEESYRESQNKNERTKVDLGSEKHKIGGEMIKRVRERERQRERDRESQRERKREIHRETEKKTEREKEIDREKVSYKRSRY